MVVDAEQPGDPGDRDASLAKLMSLWRHGLIDRGHYRVAKLNNQQQGGRGSRPLRSRPPFPEVTDTKGFSVLATGRGTRGARRTSLA